MDDFFVPKDMPYHIIDCVNFVGDEVIIYFRSGNSLSATAPNKEQLETLKEAMVKNLGVGKVIIIG